MATPEYLDALAKIQQRFPDASDYEEDIEVHIDEFYAFEQRLNLENVILRAITTPPDDDGSGMHIGKTFYHWAFLAAKGHDFVVEIIHYHPPKPSPVQFPPKIFKQYPSYRDLTYMDYIEARYNANPEFKVPKNYFIPEPDLQMKPEDKDKFSGILQKVKNEVLEHPINMKQVEADCKQYIKARFDDYLEEFRLTRNYYYLFRADFYRKLKFEHLSLDHKLLVYIAQNDPPQGYFVEGELRMAYTDRIESL